MKDYQFNGNFLYYVRLIKKMYERTLQEAAEKCGLTLPEADVLSYLRENPEFDTARDISLYREVSRAYVSKAVELLVNKGYIQITQDMADRRLLHLGITPAAQETSETLHEELFAFYDRITAGLSGKELRAMIQAIEKCAVNLTE